MKKTTKFSISLVAVAITAISVSQYFSTANGNASSAPAGYAGDPSSTGKTCAASGCHTGITVASASGWITSNIPVAGYVPGTTYSITANAVGVSSTKFGFEISPQNSSGTVLGTMAITDAAHSQLTGSNKYITHKTANTNHVWSFNWTAPMGGSSGPVTFYGAFVISNSDIFQSGDTVRTSTLTVPQDPTTGIADLTDVSGGISVSPNPVNNVISITNNNDFETMQVEIINTSGVIVKEFQAISSKPVNIEDLTKGYYVLRIKTKAGISIQKIIKN